MTDVKNITDCTILRCEVGSGLYGLKLEKPCDCKTFKFKDMTFHFDGCASKQSGDRDELGVCIEGIDKAMGFSPFENFVYRTATERTGNKDEPSRSGDLDLTIYSLKKFLSLALGGNPTIVQLLFVPQEKCLIKDAIGSSLQDLAPKIIARSSGKAFLGYLQAQRMRFYGERGGSHGAAHSEDVEKFGYDTKYAMHMLRLGYQGVQLLSEGRVSFPVSSPEREYLLSVRRGEGKTEEILGRTRELEERLRDLLDTSPLQAKPDREYVERWMLKTYYMTWRSLYHDDLGKHLGEPPMRRWKDGEFGGW